FFQSEKYFDSSKFSFQIKNKFITEANNILETVESKFTKVFVHVRRGDYLSETYNNVRGINLPMSYYEVCFNEIEKTVKNPYYIFLSDDPEFIKFAFIHKENKYISENSMGTDLAIMSLCNYGIAANSSFSWWGAYLMNNREKVFFPKYWYGWKSKIESHPEITPKWAISINL
ncbi:alpha-1,2-fucosyltransferase, partial [Candidatus Kapabacteria bacterium]|nr:alpha-1,2-fucosyltransferase [Candidatus Kapabacteria bacterium]